MSFESEVNQTIVMDTQHRFDMLATLYRTIGPVYPTCYKKDIDSFITSMKEIHDKLEKKENITNEMFEPCEKSIKVLLRITRFNDLDDSDYENIKSIKKELCL